MLQDRNLVIIGGSGRNVGKTEFACRLIAAISATATTYGLKISAIYPDEALLHGDHGADEQGGVLFEESRYHSPKDTSRMLRAGAARVFYLRSEDDAILPAYSQWRKRVPAHAAIICESNSLAMHVRPAVYIMVRQATGHIKPRARKMLERADLVVTSDGRSGFSDHRRLHFSGAGFTLETE